VDELGDLLFYVKAIARHRGVTFEYIMQVQADKLERQSEHYNRTFLK
jgi:NTP pyrophosphatase (non-canonical NTP hydrolase)